MEQKGEGHPAPLLQGFRTPDEVQRFSNMMDEMCYIVATKHSGSLKVPARPLPARTAASCCRPSVRQPRVPPGGVTA